MVELSTVPAELTVRSIHARSVHAGPLSVAAPLTPTMFAHPLVVHVVLVQGL